MVSIKSNGSIGPLAADRVPADDGKTEIGEKGDCCFHVANSDTNILKFDGHALKATKAEGLAPVVGAMAVVPTRVLEGDHPQIAPVIAFEPIAFKA
ncbi:hypothetical protein [Arthrobacter sp. FW305-BF8]|uniref:hypothetical protein n=1 Tax=Arthrobacter sp. FW305-BF8 TaxID=2879617 RepID=UPI001F1BFB49|nr:hypothetical protein [Arthrobacter sp. FW305-BF8]